MSWIGLVILSQVMAQAALPSSRPGPASQPSRADGEVSAWVASAGRAGSEGLPYRVWTPRREQASGSGWPLVVWLHGFSLRGEDLSRLTEYGPPAVIERLPARFVLVAPQLPSRRLAWRMDELDVVLQHVLKDAPLDSSRVYAAGASLGAAGAFEWVAEHPERFAGLVLLAGAGNSARAKSAARVPVWFFHGSADRTVPLAKARATEEALRSAGGAVRFTELPGVGHDPLPLTRAAFIEHASIQWMLGLERTGPATMPQAQPVRPAAETAPRARADVQEVRERAAAIKDSLAVPDLQVPVPPDETIYAWIQQLSAFSHRRPGTPEGHKAQQWVAGQLRELGLQQVAVEDLAIRVWKPAAWRLTVDGRATACGFLLNSGFTPESGVKAEMVWGGDGQIGQIRADQARGRIVVVRAAARYHDERGADPLSYFTAGPELGESGPAVEAAFPYNLLGDFLPIKLTDAFERARAAGAAGLLVLTDDLRSRGGSFYWPYDAQPKPLPALYVNNADSPAVRVAAQAGKTATLVQTGALTEGTMANIHGILPGASKDVLLVTCHHDSPHKGAVEDASGVAQMLAQAWAWSRVPQARRPLTMVFVAAAGHFQKGQGAYEFARRHGEIMRHCRAVLTLEHMPCREVRMEKGDYRPTGRTQPMTVYMPPRPDVVGAVWKALEAAPPPMHVAARRPILSLPLSDAAGYVHRSREPDCGYGRREGVPYVSWISAPLYLVDDGDDLGKIEKDKLSAVARTVAEVAKLLMATPAEPRLQQ